MATCKDCMHYAPCFSGGVSVWNDIEQTKDDCCKHFIPTANVVDKKVAELLEKQLKERVEVVRCKDCKHAYINSFSELSGIAVCRFWSNRSETNILAVQQNDFCSYGERKDGAGE